MERAAALPAWRGTKATGANAEADAARREATRALENIMMVIVKRGEVGIWVCGRWRWEKVRLWTSEARWRLCDHRRRRSSVDGKDSSTYARKRISRRSSVMMALAAAAPQRCR
jgi:hypothetical protein